MFHLLEYMHSSYVISGERYATYCLTLLVIAPFKYVDMHGVSAVMNTSS